MMETSLSFELIEEYENLYQQGKDFEIHLWMEDAVRCIKELQAEVQRLSEYEWMYNELDR
jgi:hypothetical protein